MIKRLLRILGVAVAIAMVLLVVLAIAFVVMIGQALDSDHTTVTKLDAYPELLEDWSAMKLVDHFPKTIPADATDVSLAAMPGIMQGSGYFQLRMKLPPAEIEAIEARTKAAAVRSCPSQCTTYIEDPEFWKVPRLNAGSEEDAPFPSDFIVYALETDGDWNHPTGRGIAISKARNEVVYWADD